MEYSREEIPAGGEGEIEIKLGTRGLRGRVKKKIAVMTNDPKNERINLEINAEVFEKK